jgi:predicted nucleotidyltransferase
MNSIYHVDEIRERLTPIFASEPVYRAILFGSYAKGIATESSDVDIVIDSRGELHGLNFYGVLDSITEAIGKPVDLIELSEIRPAAPILDDIKQGVVLYEREG